MNLKNNLFKIKAENKILHLMIFSKTSEEYIKFLEKNWSLENHKIILFKGRNPHEIKNEIKRKSSSNIKVLETKKDLIIFYLKLSSLKKYKKIIIHGWYYPYFSIFLFFHPLLIKKIYWVIWGGDNRVIIEKQKNKMSIKQKIYLFFDAWCKTRVKFYISQIKEEYLLLKSVYKIKGKYINCFMYPGNMYKEFQSLNKRKEKKYIIQIGNSAEERNHLEVMQKLIQFKDRIEKIYCPLSYGNSENYVESLIKSIPKELEDKVELILKIMPYKEYLNFLSNINIAIFPFKRQQAFGNISSLISMKKTIYLSENSLTYKFFVRNNIKIKSFDKLENLEVFDNEILEKNKEIIKERFSEERLIEDLKKIFEDDINGKN